MDVNLSALAYKLYKYDRVVFYGAGNIAKVLYGWLRKMGIVLDSCLVTKKESNNLYFMNSVPVYQFDEYLVNLKENNTIVLIAVSIKFEKDIESMLCDYGIKNYLLLSNFSIFFDYQANKSVDQCIEEIVKWNVFSNHNNWKSFDIVKKRLTDKIASQSTIKNRIAVGVGNLTPRVLKIVGALHNKGKEIKVYLYSNAIFQDICKDGLQKLGIPYRECLCVEELMYELVMEQAEIIHFFSCGGNTGIPYAIIKMKEIFSSHLVYDEYDIINAFYSEYGAEILEEGAEILEEERFCLEKADGVCNRGYELNYLSQKCGYRFEGKTIQFIDYCKDEDIEQEYQYDEETLSICFAGDMVTEKKYPDSSLACILEFAEKCAEAQCHLHIYPATWSEELYKEYIELGKANKYFHFHHPVPYEQLSKELSQYDYGTNPIKEGFLQKEINGCFIKEKFIYAMTNHFFDYLDAGIPIISAWPVLLAECFESKGVLIPWTIEKYNFDLLRKDKRKYRKAVEKVQKELQVKSHVHKLIEFYDSL